jgi:AcrR family transcriptional regulator
MNVRSFAGGIMFEGDLTRGERTANEIRSAAHSLFMAQGFHGTSMRQIAEKTGIAVSGIYNHYGSKEEIFKAVLLEHHPFFSMAPAMQEARGERVEEFARDAARRMVDSLRDRDDFLNLLFIELVEFNGKHIPELFDLFFPQVSQFAQRFLLPGRQLRDIPVQILVRAFMGLFFSYFMTEIMIGKHLPATPGHDPLEDFIDIYLYGILARE